MQKYPPILSFQYLAILRALSPARSNQIENAPERVTNGYY